MRRILEKQRRVLERAAAIGFALAVWQALAAAVGSAWLLASPARTVCVLLDLLGQPSFWKTLGFSFVRITGGYLSALLIGSLLAAAAGASRAVELLLWPFLSAIKATPVASFIILCLIWLNARQLSVFISFLMVLPIVYTNLLAGIRARDVRLAEMARVFSIGRGTRFVYIDLPQLRPYIESACSVGVGLAWKSGIAAEVIGIPTGSVGERLYQAKIYFSTGELFAWTAAAVLCSILLEKALRRLLTWFFDRLEAGV